MYQPRITRLPSLTCLFLASLLLIALTELACRRLPAHNVNGIIHSVPQQVSANINALISARWPKPNPQDGCEFRRRPRSFSSVAHALIDVTTGVGAPAPSEYLGLSDGPTSTAAPIDSYFLPVVASPSTTESVSSAPLPSEYLGLSAAPQSTTAPPVFLPIATIASATSTVSDSSTGLPAISTSLDSAANE